MFKVTGLPYKLVSLRLIPSVRIFLVFSILILCGSANAQKNYYVSSQGDDSNPGTSESSAWKTIAKVNSSSFLPGDIVMFNGGDQFDDTELLVKDGLRYTSYGTGKAKIGNPNSTIFDTPIFVNGKDDVEISNLFIWGSNYGGQNYGILVYNSSNVIIDNCTIRGGLASRRDNGGIAWTQKHSGYNRISNCDIRGFGSALTVYVTPSTITNLDSFIVENNYFDSNYVNGQNDRDGMRVTSNVERVHFGYKLVIRRNEIQNWCEEAIDMKGCGEIIVEENELHHNYNGDGYVNRMESAAFKVGTSGNHGTIIRYNKVYDIRGGTDVHLIDARAFNGENVADVLIHHNVIYNIKGRGWEDSAVSDSAYTNPNYAVKFYNNTMFTDSTTFHNAANKDPSFNLVHRVLIKNNILSTNYTANTIYGQGIVTTGSNVFIDRAGVYRGDPGRNSVAHWQRYGTVDSSSSNYYNIDQTTLFNGNENYELLIGTYIGENLGFTRDFAGNSIGGVNYVGALNSINHLDQPQKLKVFLQAPFVNGIMKTDLVSLNLLPANQPYNINPWNINDNSVLSNSSENYVDWILVQLRDNLTNVKYSKPAILTKDGTVVNSDGSAFSFSNISSGLYYIVIRHRNHLAIMSSVKVKINNEEEVQYDFTDSQGKSYGENSTADLGNGMWGMYAGDGDSNGIVNVIDYGSVGNFLLQTGYKYGDLDLNGVINVLDYSKTNSNLFRNSQVPN